MDHGDEKSQFLLVWSELSGAPLPVLPAEMVRDEHDVEFFEEDAYLAGLATTLATSGALRVPFIEINGSIDEAIARAARTNDQLVAEIQTYRQLMLRVAQAMSVMTRVPIIRR